MKHGKRNILMHRKEVFVTATNIVSPLGYSTMENFGNLVDGKSGMSPLSYPSLEEPIMAGKIDWGNFASLSNSLFVEGKYTKAERLAIYSILQAKKEKDIDVSARTTQIILSTTKGNVDLLDERNSEDFPEDRKYLWKTAEVIQEYFSNPNPCIVISNACISGVVGIHNANRLLQTENVDTVIVVGVDVLSEFIVSGFDSFKALSQGICKPYDKDRTGINLGEASATMILQTKDLAGANIQVVSGSITNDANHISGPSRTGEGLFLSISKTLKQGKVKPEDIDYLSGHGTATLYNDEMESIAMDRAGLSLVPMNSLKGYFGHTLGAAGVLESVIAVESLKSNTLIASYNYTNSGVSKPMAVQEVTENKNLKTALKTAAGFGGSNASVLFKKG